MRVSFVPFIITGIYFIWVPPSIYVPLIYYGVVKTVHPPPINPSYRLKCSFPVLNLYYAYSPSDFGLPEILGMR